MRINKVEINNDDEFNSKEEVNGTEIVLNVDDLWEQSKFKGMGIVYTLLTNWKSNASHGIVDFHSLNGTNKIFVYCLGDEKRAEYLVQHIQDGLLMEGIPTAKVISYEPCRIIKVSVWDDDIDNYENREIRVLVHYEM
jgi:hypothetical protein